MKKRILTAMVLALMLLLAAIGIAAAEVDALEMTSACTMELSGLKNPKNLTDRKFTTYGESKSQKHPSLTIESGEEMYGLYLCFQQMPAYEIQVNRGSGWETFCPGNSYVHAFYALDGVRSVRVYATDSGKQTMGFNEVYVFGKGRIPEWVQKWEPTPEKSDLLFVVAHPEEELLYLGGAIPWYASEQGRTVAVALMSYANTTRRSEFLNGLWSMGYRHYPIIGNFKTAKAKGVKAAYKTIDKTNGEVVLLRWLDEAVRVTRPEVMVGPDEGGEGGNGQRMMLADACRKVFRQAEEWQPQKLYLHLYGESGSQIVFDWTQPMEKLGNRTGMGLAYYAYLFHKTQDDQERSVYKEGNKYQNNVFGLAESRVGKDQIHEDFLENIPQESLMEKKEPDEIYRWTLNEVPGLPELNEKGYIDSGEFIWTDDARGYYVYISPTLRLVIRRKYDGSLPLTWFETDILCNIEAGERMVNLEFTPERAVGKKSRVDAAENALKHQLVFACNGDYYTYRVGSKNGHPVGIEIRDREVYFDDGYTEPVTSFFPNLDTLAFYEDGRIDVHASMEMTAQDYLDNGAYMVYSFGPYLIRDGKLSEWVQDPGKSRAKNPRHAFGMIEPGHYVDIMCEGRLGSRSEGVTMPQLAFLCQAAGCSEACDLDGGQTAVVIFMGQQLNQIGKYDGKTNARETCEVMGIGISEQVGTFRIQ